MNINNDIYHGQLLVRKRLTQKQKDILHKIKETVFYVADADSTTWGIHISDGSYDILNDILCIGEYGVISKYSHWRLRGNGHSDKDFLNELVTRYKQIK